MNSHEDEESKYSVEEWRCNSVHPCYRDLLRPSLGPSSDKPSYRNSAQVARKLSYLNMKTHEKNGALLPVEYDTISNK
jgi:hypothetical protein